VLFASFHARFELEENAPDSVSAPLRL
jgi:hypothetical protein